MRARSEPTPSRVIADRLGRVMRVLLLVVTAFQAVSAIGGAIGLLTPGSMGLPLSSIEDSVFSSFVGPALILLVVIGGTQLAALIALLRRSAPAYALASVAGFAMVIWIVVEVAIMKAFVLIHGVYLATGLAQLALVIALLGAVPSLVGRPDRG